MSHHKWNYIAVGWVLLGAVVCAIGGSLWTSFLLVALAAWNWYLGEYKIKHPELLKKNDDDENSRN